MSGARKRAGWIVGLLIVVGLVALPWALGIQLASPEGRPVGDLDGAWGEVLSAHVHEGRVDYEALSESPEDLERVVATFAAVGPSITPLRFRTIEARLAYYLNAYNALVLHAVVENWPIESVRDVHGPVEPERGFGFFWARFFEVDGHWTNLYYLEHDVLRTEFADARIHAALVCASRGCPALQDEPYTEARVDAQLERASHAFCAHAVRVEDERIVLNPIFEWYREDFERDARRGEWGDGQLLDYVEHYAPDADIAGARARGARVVFSDYDWSLNRVE